MTDTETPLEISGSINFRDVGGLPAGVSMTRHGVLYRSGTLTGVDERGRERLRALGIRQVIDLRDDSEVTHEPSRLDGLDLTITRVPLFVGSAASFFQDDLDLTAMYRVLLDTAGDAIVTVVRGLIADSPAIVHCSAGKDRTGVSVALTLAAAGVDREAVVADYARTQSLLPEERNARIVAAIQQYHPTSRNIVELATMSPAPVMTGLLDEVDERFGSPADYLAAQGLRDDELTELRQVLLHEG